MSHQVIITFDMDETKVQEHAEKEAGRQIAKDITDAVLRGSTWNREDKLRSIEISALEEMLYDDKDKILEKAVKEVVANLHRTKKARELMESAT